MNTGNLIIHVDSGHTFVGSDNKNPDYLTTDYGKKTEVVWDGSHWIENYQN